MRACRGAETGIRGGCPGPGELPVRSSWWNGFPITLPLQGEPATALGISGFAGGDGRAIKPEGPILQAGDHQVRWMLPEKQADLAPHWLQDGWGGGGEEAALKAQGTVPG